MKDNILYSNAEKLSPQNRKTLSYKIFSFARTFAIESLFSWINVPVILFQIVMLFITPIRNLTSPKPEAVQKLLYPMKNNPDLDAETVWAHLVAFNTLFRGHQPNCQEMLDDLHQILESNPDFNFARAISNLEALGIVNETIISDVKSFLKSA